jgi:hypothetical protein
MHTDAERKYAAKAAVSGTRVGKMELLYSIAQTRVFYLVCL